MTETIRAWPSAKSRTGSAGRPGPDRPRLPGPSGRAASGLSVELAALPTLEEEWRRLTPAARTRTAFGTWDYVSTWWSHFRRGREGRTFLVYGPRRRLLAIVPLYVEERRHRFGTARVLCNVGSGDVAEAHPLDAPVVESAERDVAHALSRVLFRDASWDYADWSDLAPNGSLVRVARALALDGHVDLRSEERPSGRSLRLPDSFEALVDGLDEERRDSIRALVSEAADDAGILWRDAGPEISITCALRILSDLERRSTSSRKGGGRFARADFYSFHRELAERLRAAGRLRLSILYGQKSPLGAAYGFVDGPTYHAFSFVHDERRAHPHLSRLLLASTLKRLIEAGVKEVRLPQEEGRGAPWTVRRRRTVSLQLVRPELRARSSWVRAGLSNSPRLVLRFLIGRERYEEIDTAWTELREAMRGGD